jgi:hypothetical protein
MKRSLPLAAIAALALTTTVQAQSVEQRHVSRPTVSARSSVNTRAAVAPSTNRTVVRNYQNSGRYYAGGTRYSRGGRYYGGGYYNRPTVSVGFGGGYYPGYYDYGYGYNSYPSDYYYGDQPTGYAATTTYQTSGYGGDLAYDDNVVIAVQERLKRAGYYLGAIDGVAGPETRSAIARWEGNHGMTADGRIDRETLRSMGIS